MEFFFKYWEWFTLIFATNAGLGWIAVRNEERLRIFTHPLNWALVALGIILWLMQTWGVAWTLSGFGSAIAVGLGTFFMVAWGRYGVCILVGVVIRRHATRQHKATATVATPTQEGVDYRNQTC